MTIEVALPHVELVDPNTLKPHPQNPRTGHPIDGILGSMERFGFTNPIIVSADGFIIAGEGRWRAALKGNAARVLVIFSNLSGDEAIAYMVADNRLAEKTGWEARLLNDLLGKLPDDLKALTGFTADEAEDLLRQYDAAQSQNLLNPVIGDARGPREVLAGPRDERAADPGVAYMTFTVTPAQKRTVTTALTVALTEMQSKDEAAALAEVCQQYLATQT